MTVLSRIIRATDGTIALWTLFTVALLLRAVAALFTANIEWDVPIWEYGLQGQCAAELQRDLCLRDATGYPYVSALMPPLTSYLWMGLFNLFGVTGAAKAAYIFLNVLIGAACAPLLYVTARRMKVEAGPAFFAGAILAAFPTFVFISAGYHATNFTVALMLMFAIAFMRVANTFDWRWALAAGALGALATMTRNELILVAVGSGFLLLWAGRKQFGKAFAAAAAMGVAFALVMSPWIVRNYVAFDRFIPVGGQAGYNLWIGFGPYARGSGNDLDNNAEARAAAAAVRATVRSGDAPGDRYELRLQQAFLDDAMPVIEQGGLGRVVFLTAQKFTVLWLFDWTDPITHHPGYWLPWFIAHVLAIYGLYVLWRGRAPPMDWTAALLIVLFLGAFSFAYSISSVFARYRMHMEPFIFMFAGVGAWQLASRWWPAINPAAPGMRT
jgi:hypothetical protein